MVRDDCLQLAKNASSLIRKNIVSNFLYDSVEYFRRDEMFCANVRMLGPKKYRESTFFLIQ